MTEEEKDWVRALLTRRASDGGQKITGDNVSRITKYRTLAQAYQEESGASPADVAWSWIAEEQNDELSRHGGRRPRAQIDKEGRSGGPTLAHIRESEMGLASRAWDHERGPGGDAVGGHGDDSSGTGGDGHALAGVA